MLVVVLFPRPRSLVVGVPGLCWLLQLPFVHNRCPVVGVLGLCRLMQGSFDGCHCPCPSALRSFTTCLVAVCVRPGCPTPRRFIPAVHPLRSTTLWVARAHDMRLDGCGWRALHGGVCSLMIEAGGVCACMVSRVIYAAWWPRRRPWFCPPQFCRRFLPFRGPPLLPHPTPRVGHTLRKALVLHDGRGNTLRIGELQNLEPKISFHAHDARRVRW